MNDHTTNKASQEIPHGYCRCGCGQKTPIAHVTDRARNWVKGEPTFYIYGHGRRKPAPPTLDFCACGCGQPIRKDKFPSHQPRFISGHNGRRPVEERFWGKVDKLSANGCWNWTGSTGNHGYGTLSVDGNSHTAHRFVWELTNGPIPNGMHILHHCDNRLCCNPSHLFLGTNLDNIHDMVKKGRQSKGASKNAKKGEENATAVLTTEQVLDIRRRAANGEQQRSIAKEYGITQGHVSNLVRRVIWKHV